MDKPLVANTVSFLEKVVINFIFSLIGVAFTVTIGLVSTDVLGTGLDANKVLLLTVVAFFTGVFEIIEVLRKRHSNTINLELEDLLDNDGNYEGQIQLKGQPYRVNFEKISFQ